MTSPSPDPEKEVARARAACLENGLSADEVATLFMQEALLAWMVDGLTEHEIHERVNAMVRGELREWFFRARLATGQCDCVREVHFAAQEELAATRRPLFSP